MIKITTHIISEGWFTAKINGYPLAGSNGGYSRFPSRKRAKEAAQERLNSLPEEDRKQIEERKWTL